MDWLWTSRQNSPLAGTRLQHSAPEIFKRCVCVTCVCVRVRVRRSTQLFTTFCLTQRRDAVASLVVSSWHILTTDAKGQLHIFNSLFSEGQLKIKFLLTPLVRTTLTKDVLFAAAFFCGRDLYKMLIQDSRVVPGSIASRSSIIFLGGTKSPTSVRLRWIIKKRKSWRLTFNFLFREVMLTTLFGCGLFF